MATAIDWTAIRAARVAGLSYPEIAKAYGVKCNTIRQRAGRERWAETLAPSREKVTSAVASATLAVAERKRESIEEQTRQILSKDCLQSAQRLESYQPTSLREESMRERFAGDLTRRASAIFDWSSGNRDGINQSITVNVACMAQLPDMQPVTVQAVTVEPEPAQLSLC